MRPLCPTSKMSHDGIWRAACLISIMTTRFRFGTHKVARGVTDVGVGSGALLGGSTKTPEAFGLKAIEELMMRGFIDRTDGGLRVREAWSPGRVGRELLLKKCPDGLASKKWTPIQAALMSFSVCCFSNTTGDT
jgi:hypothetical protein